MTLLLEAPERRGSEWLLAMRNDVHLDEERVAVAPVTDDAAIRKSLARCLFWHMVMSALEEVDPVDEPLEIVSLTPEEVRDVLQYTSSEYIMYPVELPPLED